MNILKEMERLILQQAIEEYLKAGHKITKCPNGSACRPDFHFLIIEEELWESILDRSVRVETLSDEVGLGDVSR
jgi:hypothetical protein